MKADMNPFQNQPPQLIQTADGSHTLFVEAANEHYHSVHGAIAESMHVYIQSGFDLIANNFEEINILEIGFGTGLNALLTYFQNQKYAKRINYTSIEAYPLEKNIYSKLNYQEFLDYPEKDILLKMHTCQWDEPVHFSEHFTLLKVFTSLENFEPEKEKYHLIYFDAFAPQIQQELWTKEIFEKCFSSLKKKGLLMTYSAKGEVKRNLKYAGFRIENIPGPIGKREITRGIKD